VVLELSNSIFLIFPSKIGVATRLGWPLAYQVRYFKTDLLALVENSPPLPLTARKKMLKETGNTFAEMHEKNWIHLGTKLPACPGFDKSFADLTIDVKPDNIFLNWYMDSSDEFHLGKVVLGDMDCA
jgi:serine/threonine protein kinase